jgi:hypothetical protein
LQYLALQNVEVIDLDTARPLQVVKTGSTFSAKLEMPITTDKQSAHLRITGTLTEPRYKLEGGELTFERALHGLRNTIVLPAGWDVAAVSQSATIGIHQGRSFVSLINLNAENNYTVRIRAARQKTGAKGHHG